ncbi:MAG: hypothetical protein JNM63_09185 [Spirochaetia bacterium]|nr:hypothetical protein [Spirochaetia bacterium]
MNETKIPDLLLEKWAMNECSPAQRAFVEARLQHPARTREEILLKNKAFLEKNPWEKMENLLPDPSVAPPQKTGLKTRYFLAPFAGALTLGLAILVIWNGPFLSQKSGVTGDTEVTRQKGLLPQLSVYQKNGNEVRKLVSGEPVKVGQQLRISYTASGSHYGAIFSIDGRGSLTWHFPLMPTGKESFRLNPSGEQILAQGYELDNAPEFERFFFVTSEGSVDFDPGKLLATVANWNRTARDFEKSAPPLEKPYRLFSIVLKKQ